LEQPPFETIKIMKSNETEVSYLELAGNGCLFSRGDLEPRPPTKPRMTNGKTGVLSCFPVVHNGRRFAVPDTSGIKIWNYFPDAFKMFYLRNGQFAHERPIKKIAN
jgi:hypothetical protein